MISLSVISITSYDHEERHGMNGLHRNNEVSTTVPAIYKLLAAAVLNGLL